MFITSVSTCLHMQHFRNLGMAIYPSPVRTYIFNLCYNHESHYHKMQALADFAGLNRYISSHRIERFRVCRLETFRVTKSPSLLLLLQRRSPRRPFAVGNLGGRSASRASGPAGGRRGGRRREHRDGRHSALFRFDLQIRFEVEYPDTAC